MHRWLSRCRHWTLAAAGLCFAIAAGLAWMAFGSMSPPVVSDSLATWEVELNSPSALSASEESGGTKVISLRVPMDPDESPATLTAHHTTGPADSPSTDPVWLMGTIEPLDDDSAPSVVPWEVRQAVGYDRANR